MKYEIRVRRKDEPQYSDELQHHKYFKRELKNGKWRYYYDYNNGDGWSDKKGVEIRKKKNSTEITLFNTKNTKYWDKHEKTMTKNYGPIKVSHAEDGVEYTIKFSTKKLKSFHKKTIGAGKALVRRLLGNR